MVLYGWAITQVIKIRVNRAVLGAAGHAVQVEAGHAPAWVCDWWWLMQQIKELDQTGRSKKLVSGLRSLLWLRSWGLDFWGPNGVG